MSVEFRQRGREYPFTMPENRDFHGAWKAKGVGYATKKLLQNHLTKDTLEDSQIFDMRLYSKAVITIDEIGGTNAIKYQVWACVDPSDWHNLTSVDGIVIAGDHAYESLSDAWNWVMVKVASNVAGNPGRINVFVGAKTP